MACLVHVVSKDRIMVAPVKIEAIHNWARPTFLIEVRNFIRYWQAITDSSLRVLPLLQHL